MAARQKRQKLDDTGREIGVVQEDTSDLSHSKSLRKQLFVRSLAATVTDEDLTGHFSQSYPIKHAVVVTDPSTKQCKGYGFVTLTDPEDAQRAIEELNNSELHNRRIRVEIAKQRQRESGLKEAASSSGQTHPVKSDGFGARPAESTRLIVRNLPWSINSSEKLETLFRSYGKIKHAVVPKNEAGRMKGFGIVLLRGRKNAEKALAGINGKEVDGRTVAVDWVVDKASWEVAQDGTAKEEADVDDISIKSEEGETDTGAILAENVLSDGGASSLEDESEEEDADSFGKSESVDSDLQKDEIKLESDAKAKPNFSESTLFIRNLPFTCQDEDLLDHFGVFGAVNYARVVVDQESGRPRGTGFVCFRHRSTADECLKNAPKPPRSFGTEKKPIDQVPARSVLQDDTKDPTGHYTIDGRILQLSRAVDKSEASRLTAEGTANRFNRDKDKRHLYLLQEGNIASNSPLYATLSGAEIAMRDASMKQRKSFIEKNPSLHLSLTRLAIRNIPRSIGSKELKALAREAVVGFAKDVKAGKRKALSKEETNRGGAEMVALEHSRKQRGKGLVKQAKVVFEGQKGEKVTEDEAGAGRSRGYGFVEYYTHRSALMGLRWLNGYVVGYQTKEQVKSKGRKEMQEELRDRKKRLIVEFALENAQVVQRRREREEKAKGSKQSAGSELSRRAHNTARAKSEPTSTLDGSKARAGIDTSTPQSSSKISKLAKSQQIIARKRALRRARKT